MQEMIEPIGIRPSMVLNCCSSHFEINYGSQMIIVMVSSRHLAL
jgi:hypothetical protein